ITDVQSTTGLNTGKDAHDFFVCHVERSRDISNYLIGCRAEPISTDSSTSLGMTNDHAGRCLAVFRIEFASAAMFNARRLTFNVQLRMSPLCRDLVITLTSRWQICARALR